MFGPNREPDPQVQGVIHGVRSWYLKEKGRKGVGLFGYGDYRWADGGQPTRASCASTRRWFFFPRHWPLDRPPVGSCHCGLYANHPWARNLESEYREISDPQTYTYRPAFGVIEAWGDLELHEDGFRAEFARPIILFSARSAPEAERELQAEAARLYECELVVVDSAEQMEMEMLLADRGLDQKFVRETMAPVFAPPRKKTWDEPWDRPGIVLNHVWEIGETIGDGAVLLGTWIVKGAVYLVMAYLMIALYGGFLFFCGYFAYQIIKEIFT